MSAHDWYQGSSILLGVLLVDRAYDRTMGRKRPGEEAIEAIRCQQTSEARQMVYMKSFLIHVEKEDVCRELESGFGDYNLGNVHNVSPGARYCLLNWKEKIA